ncbi:MAG: hypothetical protein N2511_06315 [Thermodesulfovibrionales bacterium]|nr:hypothetical protein [Thermodesulfovibrionales bacterium]
MKKDEFKKEIMKKGTLIGALSGFVLFVFIGLLPSLFIGGVIGLKIAKYLLGFPFNTEIIGRSIVGISMIGGIIISGLVFVIGSSLIGWLFGYVVQSLKAKTIPKIA